MTPAQYSFIAALQVRAFGYGMVGVINPSATTSLAIQRQLARNSTFMLQPGEPWPSEGPADPFTTAATTVATTVTRSTATPSPNYTGPASEVKNAHTVSAGAISGIAIGSIAIVLIATILLYHCGRRSRRDKHEPLSQQPYLAPGFVHGPHMPEHQSDMGRHSGMQRFSLASPGCPSLHDSYR
jgi:hypothetical protein